MPFFLLKTIFLNVSSIYFIYGLIYYVVVVQTNSKTDKQTYRIQLQPCSDLTIDF